MSASGDSRLRDVATAQYDDKSAEFRRQQAWRRYFVVLVFYASRRERSRESESFMMSQWLLVFSFGGVSELKRGPDYASPVLKRFIQAQSLPKLPAGQKELEDEFGSGGSSSNSNDSCDQMVQNTDKSRREKTKMGRKGTREGNAGRAWR